MPSRDTTSAGALGGSSNEHAAELRARVGALLASAVIRDEPLAACGLDIGAPHRAMVMRAEGDEPVDDLVVALDDDSRVFVQVKLKAGLTNDPDTPLGKALAQFIRAVRSGLSQSDQLVLASADLSGPLKHLAAVLDRDRLVEPGGPAPAERAALEQFREAARRQGATDDEFADVCKRLTIWGTNPTKGDAAGFLISRLDGNVAHTGKGTQAARALADIIRELARRRGGLDAVGLVRALAAREVPLAEGVSAVATVAMARTLKNYQARVAEIGSTLRLIGVPGDLGRLPFQHADAGIEVKVADEEHASSRELEHAFRRRGRVVLEGNPGGGKSTALRTLGAIAGSREDWPVPIRVHLQHLVKATDALTKVVIAHATGDLPSIEAAPLGAALERELAAGNLLLLLDGLDEVRHGRSALIERLSEWFDHLPPGVEIVVATRPSAASDAATLGLPVLRLQPPDHPRALVRAILDGVRPRSADDAWTDSREDWLDSAFERDPQLTATPLSVVVLTLIAARASGPSSLPTARAHLLKRALEDIVSGWELDYRQRGTPSVGPLETTRAEEALMIAFRVLGCAAVFAEPPTRSEIEAQVADRLREEFPLKPADGRSTAHDAIAFWDEAGLIAFDEDTLGLTLRPLGELAAAWDVALREEPQRRAWVADARWLEDFWETLALAAVLAPDVAEEWAAGLRRDGEEAELAAFAAALHDGLQLAQGVIDGVATGVAERQLADADAVEPTARTLVAMPLSADARARLRPQLAARARPGRAVLVEALVTARWNEEGPEADERLRACIIEGREKPPDPPLPEPNVLVIPERDSLYDDAYEAAAIRLAGGTRADAELVMSAFDDGRFEFIHDLRTTLRTAGHRDLADSIGSRLNIGGVFASWKDEDFEGAERRLMAWAATLAEPVDLDPEQRRRLDELGDLFESAGFNWIRPSWTEKRAALAAGWIKIAAVLGGFDLGVIAAQARIVLDDMEGEYGTEKLAYDKGSQATLNRWDRLQDPTAALQHLVEMLGLASHQVMERVGRAVAYAPAELGAVRLLEARVKVLLGWSRWYVSRLIVLIAPDGAERAKALAADTDPILRSIGAWYLAYRYLKSDGASGHEIFALLEDPDESVREAIVNGLAILNERLDEPAKQALKELRAAPRQPWVCRNCGDLNPPQPRSACVGCSTSGPDVVGAVSDLLGDRQHKPYRFVSRRRQVRRH